MVSVINILVTQPVKEAYLCMRCLVWVTEGTRCECPKLLEEGDPSTDTHGN